MADGPGSSNTAIVAILVIVLAAGILYFLGVFTPRGDRTTTTTIERPVVTPTTPAPTTTP